MKTYKVTLKANGTRYETIATDVTAENVDLTKQEKLLSICVLLSVLIFTSSTISLIFDPNIWACLGLPFGAMGALMCANRLTETEEAKE